MTTNPQQQKILLAWEEIYKKGQMSFWLLLVLREQPMAMQQMQENISKITSNQFRFEDQSLYRSLRRLVNIGMLDFEERPSQDGPPKKYFYLTSMGDEILQQFIDRNINLYFQPSIQKLLKHKHEK